MAAMVTHFVRRSARQLRVNSRSLTTDEAIAKKAQMKPIAEIAERLGVSAQGVVPFGRHKAKLLPETWEGSHRSGKLILVTAMTPTKAGEGKTTTSVGLCDGMNRLGKNTSVALREPSLGPVFGMKGGAAGGGYAQVVPMDEINLHFTGDFHAISSAHNLLSAMVDNHVYWKKAPELDSRRVTWRRVVDMNDRALRSITCGLGGAANGYPRESGFDITVASEVMAIFCLAKDLDDLRERLGKIVVGYTRGSVKTRTTVYAKDIKAEGAMTALLKDALLPNLVQTLENNPAFIHGGPFANIAHGCNSVIATQAALRLSDYVITEGGFGADLGAEKFFDIKCRKAGLHPAAAVLVATARALKLHGGVAASTVAEEDVGAVVRGMGNVQRHLENIRKFGVPAVVCINKFPTDTQAELDAIVHGVGALGGRCVVSDHWAHGGLGAEPLAKAVLEIMDQPSNFKPLYQDEDTITQKLEKIAKEIYRADGIHLTDEARVQLKELEGDERAKRFPICVAKTQYSFSDDASKLNAPTGHTLTVRQLNLCNGAEFIVAMTGSIMTMPGLPKVPSAEHISVENGEINGLF